MTSFENLYEAFRLARKGKRARPDVAAFEFDLERPTMRKISAAPQGDGQ